MADVGFVPVRGNTNEIANTPLQDGQFLFTTESGSGNKVYTDVLRDDGTVERVGILGNYVDKNGDSISGDLSIDGNLDVDGDITLNGKINVTNGLVNGNVSFANNVAFNGTTSFKAPNGSMITLQNMFQYIYPVGCIYMSTSNVNPSTLFGGTWTAWGSGRVPVGINQSDGDFNTSEKTGGAKSVTLTSAQSGLPSHSHGFTQPSVSGGSTRTSTDGTHSHTTVEANSFWGQVQTGAIQCGLLDGNSSNIRSSEDGGHSHEVPNHTHTVSGGAVHTVNAQNASQAHTNLQPYITCYMWKRTA